MSPCSQRGHTALTFTPYHLEEMGQMIRKVLVGCYFYTSVSFCLPYYLFLLVSRNKLLISAGQGGIMVFQFTYLKIFRVKEGFTYSAMREHSKRE